MTLIYTSLPPTATRCPSLPPPRTHIPRKRQPSLQHE